MSNQSLLRAVFFGDSQLQGLQGHLRAAFADQLNIVAIAPMPGASTRVYVDSGKINEIVTSQHPDVVVFVLGGNDTAGSVSRQAQLDAIGQANARGASVIWVGPAVAADPEVDARHHANTQQLSTLVPTTGARFLDSRAWANTGWGADRVHFTSEAYAQQARDLAQAVRGGGAGVPIVLAVAGALGLVGLGVGAYYALRD